MALRAKTLGVLVLQKKGTAERRELTGSRVHLGRARSNDIRLESGSVSERHAQLDHRDGFWVLTDLGSRNGTYLNGRKIDGPVPLRQDDLIYMGDFVLRIEPPPPSRHHTMPMPGRPIGERSALVLIEGSRQQPIELKEKGEITLGTDPSHDVVLTEPMASSTHCLLRRNADGVVLEDLSSNGTFLHGSRLDAPHILRKGDVITFGHPGLSAGCARLVVTSELERQEGQEDNKGKAAPKAQRLRDTEPPDDELVLGPGLAPHADLVRQFLKDAVLDLFGPEGETDEPRWKRLKEPLARCLTEIGQRRGHDDATLQRWYQSDEYTALRVELTELVKRRVGFEPAP